MARRYGSGYGSGRGRRTSAGRPDVPGYSPEYYSQPSAAELKAKAAKSAQRAADNREALDPVIVQGRKIAVTWWGAAWCRNLESYADYDNRIGRGRSYVRAGSVIDLSIERGRIVAQVQGTRVRPYYVVVTIDVVSEGRYRSILKQCGRRIENLEALVNGDFPQEMGELFANQETGLFPCPSEIHFDCSCPDWASMCKHVAAVLYAIGNRLDREPLLFFELRGIDTGDLIQKSVDEKLDGMLDNAGVRTARVIDEASIDELFGVL
ncbi:SWIM zinc finger family protein [Gordonibacter sp.]|uniref:SWIM zinc finger family protein n=1 Tax=Gordonibacter sp. TaxID=1968902 RepID=UPI002FC9758C